MIFDKIPGILSIHWYTKPEPCFICGRPTLAEDIDYCGALCSTECGDWAANDAAKVPQGPQPKWYPCTDEPPEIKTHGCLQMKCEHCGQIHCKHGAWCKPERIARPPELRAKEIVLGLQLVPPEKRDDWLMDKITRHIAAYHKSQKVVEG